MAKQKVTEKWTVRQYQNCEPAIFTDNGHLICAMHGMNKDDYIPNANLIVTAVNACKEINPENPQAVAEKIGEMYKVCIKLKESTNLVETGDPDRPYILRAKYSDIKEMLAVLAAIEKRE